MKIFVKTLIFTILVPCTVTVYIPYWLLRSEEALSLTGIRLLGILPIALGAAFYLRCAWDFTFVGKGTPAAFDPPRVLVIKGLYRWVRNPMYGGILLILAGESIVFGAWRLAGYALLFAIGFHAFVVFYEEPTLRRMFGPAYEEYLRTVPRWILRLPRAGPAG